MTRTQRVLFVRGPHLNRFETAPLELMGAHGFDVTAIASRRPHHEQTNFVFPVKRLSTIADLSGHFPFTLATRLMSRVFETDHLVGLRKHARTSDLLHAAETFLPLSAQCARLRDDSTRLVLTCWENIPFLHDDEPKLASRKRFVKARTDHFLAATAEAQDALVEEGVSRERISVVPPGIHADRFRMADGGSFRAALALPPPSRIVLYVGRLIREKGLVELVRAFSRLSADESTVLVFVGTGPERSRLEVAGDALGVGSRLRFADFLGYDEIPTAFAAADVFVLPSLPTPYWQEQFGVVLAEALAAGLPIVAVGSGSIPTVLGGAAALVAPYDTDALARTLQRVLDDTAQRAELSRAARERSAEFEAATVAARLASAYRRVLGAY